jgi:hypothetical protein
MEKTVVAMVVAGTIAFSLFIGRADAKSDKEVCTRRRVCDQLGTESRRTERRIDGDVPPSESKAMIRGPS